MIYFIIACLIVLADQVVKFLISSNFAAGGQLDLIPGILRITYVSNTVGAVMFIVYIIFFWRPGKPKKQEEAQDSSPEVSDLAPSPAPAFPEKPDHKMNSKERREYKKARKYGPDVDESTIHIPVDQIKTALGDKMTDDTIVISKEPKPEKSAPVDIPDFKPSTGTSDAEGKHEFTLEEIMREYGHDS